MDTASTPTGPRLCSDPASPNKGALGRPPPEDQTAEACFAASSKTRRNATVPAAPEARQSSVTGAAATTLANKVPATSNEVAIFFIVPSPKAKRHGQPWRFFL